jgi:hypothetical protein
MLGWDQNGFLKKQAVTRYAEYVFLHQVGSAWHVEHFVRLGCEMSTHYFYCSGGPDAVSIKGAPGHIMSKLCTCIQWDL